MKALEFIWASNKSGSIAKIVSLVTKETYQNIFIVNIVKNAIKDQNNFNIIALKITNVILVLWTIIIVKNVKAVIKGLRINIFIVKNVFNVTKDCKKTGFTAINAGYAILVKKKNIIIAKNAIFVSNMMII
jgi:hypothetical protein